jgi:general secretion pathway protein A
MYEQFFGFRERPFELTANPRFLVLSDSHREALSNLEYGIAGRKGITLLLGDAGSGKTTLVRAAIDRQPARVHTIHLHNPTLTRNEFVEILAAKFGLSTEARRSKAEFLIELENLLRSRSEAGESSVLIVDEAQSLPLELLEEIRLLANIETYEQKLLSVIIAGQPELGVRLDRPDLRQLKQRVALRCVLRPLSLLETTAYLAGRVSAAGGVGAQVFTREAVTVIFEHSRGVPRMINVIADNALLGGFAAGERPVNARIVREVTSDFQMHGDGDPARGAGQARPGEHASRPVLTVDGAAPRGAAAKPDTPQRVDTALRPRRFSLFGL